MSDGRVFLVGAGPGEPGLITLRGLELLKQANVVVYDRLAHRRLLNFCGRGCEFVAVGKRAGHHSVKQEEIIAILVREAKSGKKVVRLKGGDPFVFGRGGEEARALREGGVDFEVVPGVTASVAAGGFAGIPLTQREISSTLVWVTGHEDPSKSTVSVDWRALGALKNTTLCIYMGITRLAEIVAELQEGGLSPDTPAACVQWASLSEQKTIVGKLGTLVDDVAAAGLGAPAIVFIGDVVKLRDEIAWFETRPLFGRRVVVTRNREQAGELSQRLEALGATVMELPLVSVRADVKTEIREEVFEGIGSYDWLVFSSANGVKYFFDEFLGKFKDIRALGVMRIAAVGEATARAIRRYHLEVEIVPAKAVAEELAAELVATGSMDSAKVLVVTGNLGRGVLVEKLDEARAIVDTFPVYRNEKTDLSDDPVAADFRAQGADAILFTSSSGVKSFVAQAGSLKLDEGATRPIAGSIGPITSETMRASGMPVDFEATEASLDSLVEALVEKVK